MTDNKLVNKPSVTSKSNNTKVTIIDASEKQMYFIILVLYIFLIIVMSILEREVQSIEQLAMRRMSI